VLYHISPVKQVKSVVTPEINPSNRVEPLAEAIRGFNRATRRVGPYDHQRLSWLLEFLYLSPEKLAQLSAPAQQQWRYDLAYFVASGAPLGELPPLEEIATFAREIRSGIEQLRRTTRWTLKLPKDCTIERTIEPQRVKRAGRYRFGGYQSLYTSDDFQAAFLLCAADAVEAEGARIKVCARKDCERVFARHRRARYCSPRCSQKERDARFSRRLSKTERSKRRHSYYKSRMAKLKGRATADKVRTRPAKPTPREKD
jgi:hypothetical protein